MNLQEFIKKHGNVNVNEKELKELLGIKDDKYFKPEKGEVYWIVHPKGYATFYENNLDNVDSTIFDNNEIFETKEETDKEAETQRFLLKMKRDFLDNSEEIDWTDPDTPIYYIEYDHKEQKINIVVCKHIQTRGCSTTNHKWIEQYVKGYEEEIKKAYFEIKE